jgi:hypothetical protein
MLQAYHFTSSWQLFPEKGNYEQGERPRSGTYRIFTRENDPRLHFEMNWANLQGQAFMAEYSLVPDGQPQPVADIDYADEAQCRFIDGITMESVFLKNGSQALHLLHEIMPNGYLRITRKGTTTEDRPYTDIEFYHKQMSVLPYSSSVSGAVIRPTKEGVIRHKALTAMEEQTNMQLEQIRKQVELLALQAQEIQKRKELSAVIYDAKLNFAPVIGHTYYLYEKRDGTHLLSMVSPREWGGGSGPYQRFIAQVKLLADHTWMEIQG